VKTPRVSVIIATWNASHLLRYAIGSVLRQDLPDFELLVIGDHCTDDTGEVVASFDDPRIHFTNLPTNSGQQATPNNVGLAGARGRYVAFLNHDDLFLPHHLSSGVARLEQTGADVLVRAHATIPPEQREKLGSGELLAIGDGYEHTGHFSPRNFHVASSWLMTRRAAERVGPWRLEHETWATPSQDWLFRAWRSGLHVDYTREISMVAIYCGARRNAYRERDASEHAFVYENVIASDRLRPQLLASAEASIDAALSRADRPRPWHRRIERRVRGLRDRVMGRLLAAAGLHPNTLRLMGRYGWRRGGMIRNRKQLTG
jgi:glycosyltransferase involved in cell wall biosynthesis